MRAKYLLHILVLLNVSMASAQAQAQYRGVVWDQPTESVQALDDLRRMSLAGVNAVRTGEVSDTTLLAAADSFGIQFFQDLPLHFLTVDTYADSIATYLDTNLDRIDALSRRFASARTIGLSTKSDTSEPGLCSAMDAAATQIARATSGRIATYYVTEFLENDACSNGRVFSVYGRSAAERYITNETSGNVVGLSVGYEVVHGRHGGWRHKNSEEQQARRLERTLGKIVGNERVAAVFINRWTDDPSRSNHDSDALKRHFGILGVGNTATKALAVVTGFYTESQRIFAIDAGREREITGVWLVVLGWILLGSVATAYALSPQMRQMAPRYFMSHGFYRESVAEGRDAIPIASLVMLFAIALSAGLIGTVIITHFSETRVTQAFVFSLPMPMQNTVPLFITQPALLCILIACLYAIFMTSWTSLLSFWSRFGKTLLLPWQTLLLVVWPRWPILLVMLAALSVGAGDPTNAEALVICGVTLITALASIYRSINDYRLTAGLTLSKLVVPLMLNPSLLLLLVAVVFVASNKDTAEFLIHLLRLQ